MPPPDPRRSRPADGGVFGSTFRTEIVSGAMKDRLIAAKERKARAAAARPVAENAPGDRHSEAAGRRRVPPGQHVVEKWPVLDLGPQPAVDRRDWTLRVGGKVVAPLALDWRGFEALPAAERVSDLHCVTNWSLLGSRWSGVAFSTILEHVKPTEEARFVIVRAHDGYATNLPIAHLREPDVMLATHRNGEPISREHGGPVRLLLPKLYLWKSVKWARHIWFTDRDVPGFWEARGYHAVGDPWKEQRYGSS